MTEKWIRDTGLIFALVALFFAYRGSAYALLVATFFVASVAFFPQLLFPLAYSWHWVSRILGAVVPKVFFGLVFFLIITPVGLLRRLVARNPLAMSFDAPSAFHDGLGRLVTKDDLLRPFQVIYGHHT